MSKTQGAGASRLKVFMIFGTRAEAVKMAPLINEVSKTEELQGIVCVTAQHKEMLAQVLQVFDINPEYNLNIMTREQDLFDITTRSLLGLKEVFNREEPDLVLVQGDTTTAFAAGLASYFSKIPLGHIEAGLRTYDKYGPFPEEGMRHLIAALVDFHFAPTKGAKTNLIKEGISENSIWITGNTVVDTLLFVRRRQEENGEIEKWENYFREACGLETSSGVAYENRRIILVTGHRRESFGNELENICLALKNIAALRKNVAIVYPVHLNPSVQRPVRAILGDEPAICLLEPLDYEPFVYLMSKSYLVITDSGGIQEEAPSLGKPVLVTRRKTERPEGIEAGIARLVGTDRENIVRETLELLDDRVQYERMSRTENPYGDGKAALRIVEVLKDIARDLGRRVKEKEGVQM